jgi:hypothetical protein
MPLKTLEERIKELSTFQLKEIVEIEYKDYSEEYVLIAKDELEKRLTNPNYSPVLPPKNMHSFWGTGTMLYGRREVNADGSYVATTWRTLFFFPIVPIASFRVRIISIGLGIVKYEMEPLPLNKKQVLNIYGLVWSVVAFLVLISLYGNT